MIGKIGPFLVKENISVKDAMKQMDKNGEKVILVVDNDNRLLGSLTDGDIRRWILANGSLVERISKLYNKKPKFVKEDYVIEDVKKLMLEQKIEWIPVVNEFKQVVKVLLWDNIFSGKGVDFKIKIDAPVVIMAGGKGTRLDPFTKVLPKPLIPVGESPIIDIIMQRFYQHGVKDFYISINHKAKMIKSYFEEMNTRYNIHYLEEKKPLGTAGSLKFLEGKIKGSLLVSNCDIIVDCDYAAIMEFHEKNDYDITIVGSFRHYVIPYGICEIKDGGLLKGMIEKPEYDFLVNTGMYVVKGNILHLIPRGKKFNVTELVKSVRDNGGKVGVFPISEKAWIDIGQWEEYKKAIEKFQLFK